MSGEPALGKSDHTFYPVTENGMWASSMTCQKWPLHFFSFPRNSTPTLDSSVLSLPNEPKPLLTEAKDSGHNLGIS